MLAAMRGSSQGGEIAFIANPEVSARRSLESFYIIVRLR
jgi:hypothetical protein